MSQESELIRLENYVGKLLQSFREQKDENTRLMLELQDREETISNLREQVATNERERNEIGDRVSRMIGRIEDWETNMVEETDPADQPNLGDDADLGAEAHLEEEASREAGMNLEEESGLEDENGLESAEQSDSDGQGSLFVMGVGQDGREQE